MMSDFKYWAFLSYSHQDKSWVDWLHKALETYRVPKALVGRPSRDGAVPAHIFPIFRDREELPVAADLSANIAAGLRQSRYLIVVCSPRSAKSRWVNEEVLNYKRLGRADRVLALIVDGEPNAGDGKPGYSAEHECFPPALRFDIGAQGELSRSPTEPIAADARGGSDGKINAKLKLLAGLLGVNFDDLKQRENERRIRRLRRLAAAAAALLSLFVALSAFAFRQAKHARTQQAAAEQERSRAQEALAATRRALSQSDFLQALRSIADHKDADALAQLARSLRQDPRNLAALCRLTTLLTYHNLDVPPVRLTHPDGISFAQFSRDGKRVVTASAYRGATVWDADTGKRILSLKHDRPVRVAQFSPDGLLLLTVCQSEPTARVWDMANGKLLRSLQHADMIAAAEFSPDGGRILTGSLDGTARIWDARSGNAVGGPIKHDGAVFSAHFSRDGTKIVTGTFGDNSARIWDAQSGRPLVPKLRHVAQLWDAQLSPDCRWVITATPYSVLLWDAQRGEQKAELHGDFEGIDHAELSADGTRVMALSQSRKRVLVWDIQTATPLPGPHLDQPDAAIASTELSPDGTLLLTVGKQDQTVRIWDARSGRPALPPLAFDEPVSFAHFSPDGMRLVVGLQSHVARIVGLLGGGAISQPLALDAKIGAISPDGKGIVTLSWDVAQVRDASDGKPSADPLKHDDEIYSAVYSPDGGRVATASQDKTARIWEAQNGKLRHSLQHVSPVGFVQFNHDGKKLLTVTSNGRDYLSVKSNQEVRVWDVDTGLPIGKDDLKGIQASFTPDGGHVAVLSSDRSLAVWEVDGGRQMIPPLKPPGGVQMFRSNPDGTRLLTICGKTDKGYVGYVWDAHSGKLLGDTLRHEGGISSAEFSPDGRDIVTACEDGAVRVWNAQTGAMSVEAMKQPMVSLARFSPDGTKILTVSGWRGLALVRDARSGKPLSDTIPEAPYAAFSSDGRGLILSAEKKARRWDLGPSRGVAPQWFLQLAEAVAGEQLNDRGVFESLDRSPSDLIQGLREELKHEPAADDWVIWGRWFLADRRTRSISPFSKMTVSAYIENRISENTAQSLDDAEMLAIGNATLFLRISQARSGLDRSDTAGAR